MAFGLICNISVLFYIKSLCNYIGSLLNSAGHSKVIPNVRHYTVLFNALQDIYCPESLFSRTSCESEICSFVSNSLWPRGLYSPWNSPGQNTGVGSLSLLQGIFPTQGQNPGLPHCRWILYQLSHKGRRMSCIPPITIFPNTSTHS